MEASEFSGEHVGSPGETSRTIKSALVPGLEARESAKGRSTLLNIVENEG